MSVPRLITLNVSGTKITTFRETLTRGSPYFAALFSGKWGDGGSGLGSLEEEVTPAKQNPETPEFFLDMDPDLFRMLLNRMRYPEMSFGGAPLLPPGLREAAEFLGMDYETETEQKRKTEVLELLQLQGAELCLRMLERLQPGDKILAYSISEQKWMASVCTMCSPRFEWYTLSGGVGMYRKPKITWNLNDIPDGYIRPIDDKSRVEILSREVVRKRPQSP